MWYLHKYVSYQGVVFVCSEKRDPSFAMRESLKKEHDLSRVPPEYILDYQIYLMGLLHPESGVIAKGNKRDMMALKKVMEASNGS